jgi:hypothetical protein
MPQDLSQRREHAVTSKGHTENGTAQVAPWIGCDAVSGLGRLLVVEKT